MRTQLEEYQTQIQTLQSSYLRKIELMEVRWKKLLFGLEIFSSFFQKFVIVLQTDELVTQKRLRTELLQMDDVNSQLRKEYEMLRMEFEQNLVANEQTGPINREMRHLITSLQDHNIQLKSDVHRYKRKYKELSAELGRVMRTAFDSFILFVRSITFLSFVTLISVEKTSRRSKSSTWIRIQL